MNFTIPIEPKTKKNNQRIVKIHGHYSIMPSKEYKAYEKACGEYIPQVDTIIDPVNIKCTFYRRTHIRCDLTNLLEAIDDILVKYGVIQDDNYKILVSHDGSRVYVDKENPRTEIQIEKYDNKA